MVEELNWAVPPWFIIGTVTAKTQDGNRTESVANISTSEPHEHQSSRYYAGINEVVDIKYSVNPNAVSLHSDDFAFTMNPNGPTNDIYIGIVSNMLKLTARGIFSANQVCAVGHFYDDKPRKLGGKQQLVTTDGREIHIFIIYGLAWLPVRCNTYKYMESLPKVIITPYGEWKISYLDDDGQW